MPIYEYRCRACGISSSHLILRQGQAQSVSCPHCGGRQLDRLLSRFATPKSDEARMEGMSDSSLLDNIDDSDPASMARAMHEMGDEFGAEFRDDLEATMEAPHTNSGEEPTALDETE